MPLIKKPPAGSDKKAVTISMPVEIIFSLHEYARFLGSSLGHVVIEALRLVFKRDAEFRAWQIQQQALAPKTAADPESPSAAFPLQFSERKRDGSRATGEKSREG